MVTLQVVLSSNHWLEVLPCFPEFRSHDPVVRTGLPAFHPRVSKQESNAAAVVTPSAVRRFIRQDSDSVWRALRVSA